MNLESQNCILYPIFIFINIITQIPSTKMASYNSSLSPVNQSNPTNHSNRSDLLNFNFDEMNRIANRECQIDSDCKDNFACISSRCVCDKIQLSLFEGEGTEALCTHLSTSSQQQQQDQPQMNVFLIISISIIALGMLTLMACCICRRAKRLSAAALAGRTERRVQFGRFISANVNLMQTNVADRGRTVESGAGAGRTVVISPTITFTAPAPEQTVLKDINDLPPSYDELFQVPANSKETV